MRQLFPLESKRILNEVEKVINALGDGVKKLELKQPYSEKSDVFITGYWVCDYIRIDIQFKDSKNG